MQLKLNVILFVFVVNSLSGQQTDTLTFYSKAFQAERTVYVKRPEFFKYQSDLVKLPVIYLLDGQHEWFVQPLSTTLSYLQYTHEIPQALQVIIPLANRMEECKIHPEIGLPNSLHQFITEDVDKQLQTYRPGDYKMIIGHSFSASFALYSFLQSPEYYAAVIAHTPLDQLETLIREFEKNKGIDLQKISLSVGGIATDKDYYHRRFYDQMKGKYPSFFSAINTFEANHSAHNAVPMAASGQLLCKVFEDFSGRFTPIAAVDESYQLTTMPVSVETEIQKIHRASQLGKTAYPPEIPEINGLASRYLAGDLGEYAKAVYELGYEYFPHYYEFHLALYELQMTEHPEKAKWHLNRAQELLQNLESALPEKADILNEIQREQRKNGW